MSSSALCVIPVKAPVFSAPFDFIPTLADALHQADATLQDGDVLAISSKYVAISENRIVTIDDVIPTDQAQQLAEQYRMDARIAQLVIDEADHIFGGIPMGYLLTWRSGIIAPNAGLDRSNIPNGLAVLLPADPYASAHKIRDEIRSAFGVTVGIILTDSWLVPGRWGTTGVALSSAGFEPVEDERGKADLFGNPMTVTQRGVADSLSVAAQTVMGERDEATPFAIIRNARIQMTDRTITQDDVAIPWEMCIYVESLTLGLLPGGAPRQSMTANLPKRDISGTP